MKKNVEKITKIIESCWDENNPDDGLSFDERLRQKAAVELDEESRSILEKSMKLLEGDY